MTGSKQTRALQETRSASLSTTLLAVCGAAGCGAAAAAPPPPLPVPCAAAACGAVNTWVTSGSASLAQSGSRMDINQTSPTATLNWQSFDIASGNTVNFTQPSTNSVALNKIFEANPSQIFGTLSANGQVYLLNPNGLIFGPHSVVNVGGLVASSLAISQAAVKDGIAGAINDGQPAFEAVDDNGNPIQNLGVIDIQPGASITSNQGEVLIFAPTVTNQGTIQTPSGQTILGAGQRVFLSATNQGSAVRGLLIEVGGNGAVTNGTQGQIVSTAGDVTLAGLAVNQMGRVSATTTIDSNGSIRLEAQTTTDTSLLASPGHTNTVRSLANYQSGTLILGAGSSTDIGLQGSTSETTVDATSQPVSSVELDGGEIEMLDGSSIVAPHGDVALNALSGLVVSQNPTNPQTSLTAATTQPDSSRIWLAPTSVIDVSGATVSQSASLNSLAVELNSVELADSPQQKNGPLHGQTVYVDIRQHGTSADGTPWVGSPIADLTGDVAAIQRDVFQRSLTGGSIELNSSGSVIVSPGATINVSGGQIDWQAGYVRSSILVGANGQLSPISAANPYVPYVGTLDSINQSDPHWGNTAYFTLPGHDPRGVYQPAYVQGEDAGTVSIVAPAFVLEGNVEGSAARGPLQVNPQSAVPANEMYHYADQVPVGGQLIVGNPVPAAGAVDPNNLSAEVLQNLTFSSSPMLAGLPGSAGGAFDPSVDPLPSGFVSELRPELLGSSGVSRLQVSAEGSITVPAGTVLRPGAGGSVSLESGRIDLAGSILASDGSVTLETVPTPLFGAGLNHNVLHNDDTPSTQLELAPGASIDVSGTWVNEDPALGSSAEAPLFISGGSVQFLAPDGGSLVLSPGSSVNVSGGAQRTPAGGLVAGHGGSVVVTAIPSALQGNPQGSLEFGASLFAFALDDGGSLALTLPAVCVSSLACSDPDYYRIDPSYLTDFGFEKVSLASQGTPGGLIVAQDVDTGVRQLNLEFTRGSFDSPSADSLAGLTTVVTLPQYLRHPEGLSLSSASLVSSQLPSLGLGSNLTIAQGASLVFDPQATVSLATNSRIFMNGSLTVPAGSISLDIRSGLLASADETVIGNQAIWLGPDSTLDASGAVVLTPNNLGLQLGNVLPGGTVSVNAERGYLLALPGSAIFAGGTTAVINESSPGSATYQLATVASAGGTIDLAASEGMQLDGTLAAPAGAGASAAGGTLSLTLNGDDARHGNPQFTGGDPLLSSARTLTITTSNAPTVIGEGATVPDSLNGQGRIAASTIQSGGFDNLDLAARDLLGQQQTSGGGSMQVLESVGAVVFDPGVSLSPRASLVIDAPELRASGGQVSLSSAYVALGSTDTLSQQVNGAATAGTASLAVSAQLIDLVGAMDLNGFDATSLSSSGDIRTIGVQLDQSIANGNSGYGGSLIDPGALTLTAQQIYPTTLTSYTIELTGDSAAKSTLTLNSAPGAAGTVLSAAGSLTLMANQITDGGVLRAPIGTINVDGTAVSDGTPSSVTLASGAVVSVSADGTTIPFGETQGGLDWTYVLRAGSSGNNLGGDTIVYGTGSGDLAPPQKQVGISADDVQFSPGATIDVSGGGDLVAYEFTPGLGGTNDVLSTSFAPNTYAVIPGLTLPYSPVDPHEDIGFNQPVGSSVYLSGGNGLPAGTYALLPARYALLPGAYLVTPVSGYTNLAAGQSVTQADGSTVVSGYRTVAGTGIRDSQTSGWDVMPGSYAYQEAQYTLTSANSFFAAQAVTNNVPAPRLPGDAGGLTIEVTSAAELAGRLVSTPADGGRGGTLDLTATNLYIGANAADAPSGASYVTIDPSQLDAVGAESILLGATRSATANTTSLEVSAQNVVLGQDSILSAPEVMLAASGALEIQSGAQIEARGSAVGAEASFTAPAGTALVRASTGAQVPLTYGSDSSGSSGPASLTVAQGATISATGSMSFDAAGAVDFTGSLSAANAAVRIGGTDIALGSVPAGFNGFAVGASLLANLANSQLALDASAPITVYGPVDLTLNSLDIAAPGIDVSRGGALDVTADSLTLSNPGGSATAAAGTGSVSLTAAHVVLDQGAFTFLGAYSTAITAIGDLTGTGNGSLVTAGNLSLTSPLMQSAAGVDYAFTATGALATALPATGAAAATSASGPGGAFAFSGSSVELGSNIVLPAGRVEATANAGDVTVAGGATIDLAGFSETFDGETESAGGGTVGLSSATGNVTVAPTALIDVSAGSGGAAGGELDVSAPDGAAAVGGQIRGGGGAQEEGGTLSVEARSLDFGSLAALAGSGGFSGAVDIHERGPGDFVIGSGTTLRANEVDLTADQGNIEILGGIDASNALGGNILLAAGNDVDISGTLSAGSPTRADRGGTVKLYTTNGGIFLNGGASIDVGGFAGAGRPVSQTGTVWLRAPAQSVLSVLGSGPQRVSLGGTITGAAHVYLEGYTQVAPDGGLIDDNVIGNAQTAAASFVSAAMPTSGTTVAQALGQAGNPAFSVVPGIEIDSPGSLTVSDVWDFSAVDAATSAPLWRYGPNQAIPGVLTVRAAGSLIVDASISDGFDGTTENYTISGYYNGFQLDPAMQTSWSYRLAAGANLASANPLAVVSQTELAPEQAANPLGDAPYGSVSVASGGLSNSSAGGASTPTMIRTGTGSIDIAAAGDLKLGNQASVIYTAGAGYSGSVATGDGTTLDPYLGLPVLSYPVGGGSVSINVGQNVLGATSDQLFTNWLWRSGETTTGFQTPAPVSWLPAFDYFEQGVGALGGGDLTVRAGGNIVDLGANVPSAGIPEIDASGGVTTNEVNDGVLRVTAGGNIEGGKFLNLAGQAFVTAGGQVTSGSAQAGAASGLSPVLALGGGQLTMSARQSVSIDAIVDPTLLPVSGEEHAQGTQNEYAGFSTYGDTGAVELTSTGGDVGYLNDNFTVRQSTSQLTYTGLELEALPPTLQAVALGGDVDVYGSAVLWPSAHGNLNLLAAQSVNFNDAKWALSDADPASLPTSITPSRLGFTESDYAGDLQPLADALASAQIYPNVDPIPDIYAPHPVHGGAYAADGAPDLVPARVVALDGDVTFHNSQAAATSIFNIAKPIDIIAGGNIVDLSLSVQQFSDSNITNVIAGGDITFPSSRDPTGALVQNVSGITVAGPGRLDVQAGGTINLGTSEGISTIGNLLNPALPAGGANVTVSAGISQAPAYASFINTYIAQSDLYDEQLIQFVEQLTGATGLDKAQALAALLSLPSEQQAPFLQQLLFDELRTGGRAAAAAGPDHGNFTSAFAALEALFPGSTADKAENDPYSGDILLYFSKVYTVGGGDINLLAPGGLINVGLAIAPTAFGVSKPNSDLGIVAAQQGSINMVSYGDIDVNQSRVFAADGGDILMWSTQGNIDAGRGARSAISAPPPTITINPQTGTVTQVFPNALTGSGIQALSTTPGTSPGSVDLFAPHGVVDANEAGIVAGNITIYAVQVLGTNNISFSGTAVGVPVSVTGLGASLAAASSSGAAAGSVGQSSVTQSSASKNQAPQAQAALNWLDVFILGLGEAQCAPDDLQCIKRQEMHQ